MKNLNFKIVISSLVKLDRVTYKFIDEFIIKISKRRHDSLVVRIIVLLIAISTLFGSNTNQVLAQTANPITGNENPFSGTKIEESLNTFFDNFGLEDGAVGSLVDELPLSAAFRSAFKIKPLSKRDFKGEEPTTVVIDTGNVADMSFKLQDAKGAVVKADIEVVSDADPVVVKVHPPHQYRPGKYKISVTNALGETSSQDFTWGVLAINPDRSIYTQDQTAFFSLAVLNDTGDMVCNAEMTLKITDPTGTTVILTSQSGQIIINPECFKKEYTTIPDYQTTYKVGGVGIYNLELTAVTPSGTRTINDSFEVRSEVPFDIERQGPTRIYPPITYPVKLTVKANQDFSGTITEVVPKSFKISQSEGTVPFESVEARNEEDTNRSVLGASIFGLGLPYAGNSPVTLGFGRQHKDPTLFAKYTHFGVLGHDGADFGLAEGSNVLAADSGEVVMADKNGPYGYTVVIQHSWGKSYYGHLSKFEVEKGERVSKGDLIALSGSTGLSSGPHLHFSIKPERNDFTNGYFGKVDPLPFLGLRDPGINSGQVAGVATSVEAEKKQGVQIIKWNVSVKKGETIKLGYKFDAPQVSPELYLTGPAEFTDNTARNVFTEAREWQIAADSIVVAATSAGYSASVIVTGGVADAETQYGGNQRKVAYSTSSSAWYAFVNCDASPCSTGSGGKVYYSKSSNGTSWGSQVDFDSSDSDNYNPSIFYKDPYVYAAWIDDGSDVIEVNRIDTSSADSLGTKCSSSSPGTLSSTYMVSIAVTDNDNVYLALSDTTGGGGVTALSKLTFTGCSFTDISVCGFGTDIGGSQCRGFFTTTGTGQFIIPPDWSNTNTIEAIGGGGAGGLDTGDASAGGGGGGYSTASNISGLSGTITYSVGAGGTPSATQSVADGDDTWFNHASTCASAPVCAGGGGGALDETPAGTAGTGGLGTADTGSNGGAGGTSGTAVDDGGGGGGGAAGPGGAGGNGGAASGDGGAGGGGAGDDTPANGSDSTTDTGGAGGAGPGESGGGTVPGGAGTAGTGGGGAGGSDNSTEDGGNGATGNEWTTHGAGGGGGGGSDAAGGGEGGLYGGGGGGHGEDYDTVTEGNGGQGLIVVTYTRSGSAHGLTAGDRPILVPTGNSVHMIFQDGNLSHSIYNGSGWTISNQTIASDTNTTFSAVTNAASLWVLSSSSTATSLYKCADTCPVTAPSWSSQTAPWTSETNVLSTSLTYESGDSDLYATIIKDSSEKGYIKTSDATTISWGSDSDLGFTAGDVNHISSTASPSASTRFAAVVNQTDNFEASVFAAGVGIAETDVQFGGLQRKVVYSTNSNNWYAFYNDGGQILYKKSSNGVTWGSAVDVDATEADTDNYNPSIWYEAPYIYVAWIDDSGDDIEVRRIDTSSSDSLGTKCTSAITQTIGSTFMVSVSVADVSAAEAGTVYFSFSDTNGDSEYGVYKLIYSTCTFTDIGGTTTATITGSNLASGANGTDATTMQTSSFTPTANCLVLFSFSSRESDIDFTEPASITGNNLTWVQVSTAANPGGESRYFGVYRAMGSSPTTGTITVDWEANETSDYLHYSVDQFCNVDTSGTNGSGAIVQAPTPAIDNTGSGTSSITLAAFGDATNNVAFGASLHHNLSATTPDATATYTELSDTQCGAGEGCSNDRRVQTQWKTGQDTTVTTTFTSAVWAQFGIEIKAGTSCVCGLTAGDRPVVVTQGENPVLVYTDGSTLRESTALNRNGTMGWAITGKTIGSVTDNFFSVATDQQGKLWALTVNAATTGTNFYSIPTPVYSTIAAGIGGSGTDYPGNDIFCITADNCKMIYHDVVAGDIYFADCNDEDCDAPTLTLIDNDIGTGSSSSIAMYCPTSSTCKLAIVDRNTFAINFAYCNNSESCAGTSCTGSIANCTNSIDAQVTTPAQPNIDMTCPQNDGSNCKIVWSSPADNELILIDCEDADCSTPVTAVVSTFTGAPSAFPGISCPTSDNCKIIHQDTGSGDVIFVDCTADEDCSTNSKTTIDADTGTTRVGARISCATSSTCAFIYSDNTDGDITFGYCNSSETCAGTSCTAAAETNCTDIDTNSGTGIWGVDISCLTNDDCKLLYRNNVSTDAFFVNCNNQACTSSVINGFDDDHTGTRTSAHMHCISTSQCNMVYEDTMDANGNHIFVKCSDISCGTVVDDADPWSGQTNLTSASLTYDVSNNILYAAAIMNTSELAYWKSSPASSISWSSQKDIGFQAGDLGHISTPMMASSSATVNANKQIGAVLRQSSNFEFNVFGVPTNLDLMRHGKWFINGLEQAFTF